MKTAIFANGCFWCTEAVFAMLKGVQSVKPGYTGGSVDNPTYDQVCGGDTGHAQAIKIEYDSSIISYDDLLAVFFGSHDPTTLNQQGNDIGTQYRSAIFYTTDEEKEKAEKLIQELNENKAYDKPVVTEVAKLEKFYEAENYHQEYYKHNPNKSYCMFVIAPKLEKVKKRFEELVK